MPKKRKPSFVGSLVPDKRGRGKPTETPAGLSREMRRMAILMDVARAVLAGATVTHAMESALDKHDLGDETLAELWKANREDALNQAARELVAMNRITAEAAITRISQVLQDAEERRNRHKSVD